MTITPPSAAAWIDSADTPDDGDDEDAASVNVSIDALFDRTEWLKARTPWLASQDEGPSHYVVPIGAPISNTNFLLQSSTGWAELQNANTGGNLTYEIPNPMPSTGSPVYVANIECQLIGKFGAGAGHGASKPANMPILRVSCVDATGATSNIGMIQDVSAVATYDTRHTLEVEIDPPVLVTGKRIILEFVGESGVNAVATTLALISAKVGFTCGSPA